jgi:pathogenesis-related protein 1
MVRAPMPKSAALLVAVAVMAGCVGTIDDVGVPPNPTASKDAGTSAQNSAQNSVVESDATDEDAAATRQDAAPTGDGIGEDGASARSDDANGAHGGAADSGQAAIEDDASAPSIPSDASEAGADPESGRLAGITAEHNLVRSEVQTSPALPPLTWSATLAAYAQEWATSLASDPSTCAAPQHRPASELEAVDYGENLATFGGSTQGGRGGSAPMDVSTAKQAVDGWAAEAMCWMYGTIQGTEQCNMTCTDMLHSDGCGHYTQIVWRKSLELGCGVATCMSGSLKQDIWICNYAPAGNVIGRAPY